MAVKDYGAGVSGYLDPDGYNWETSVYQASKPLLDKEMNLVQDVSQKQARILNTLAPSGWLNADVLDTSEHAPFFIASTVANELKFNAMTALVNGWPIVIDNTGENSSNLGSNQLDMGASPAGVNNTRTDLVILEVWRRLISGSPSTTGKSFAARIWFNGNVKINAADDVSTNLVDDIVDGSVGTETTKRVQIQYRLRVIQGVDLGAYPYGIDDPTVVANSVPAAAAAPDGVATVYDYGRSSTDFGLWVAGDGVPSNTLGTVDGYMYALPVMAIFRRNTAAWAITNPNGGEAYPGPSTRPDGLFYDNFDTRDILDLRNATSFSGWDYQELLAKNVNYVLDNSLRTEYGADTLAIVEGHTQLTADEIGPTDNPFPTNIGSSLREFDAAARRFSDRSILETVVLRYTPADASGGGPNWAPGDTLTIDTTALPIYPYASVNVAAASPANISLVGFRYMFYVDESATAGGGLITVATGDIPTTFTSSRQKLLFYVNSGGGLGQVPQGSLSITVHNEAAITTQTLFIVAVISYPVGEGLTYTPTKDFGSSSLVIETPAQLPVTPPIDYSAIEEFNIDQPHREVEITYHTNEITYTYTYTIQASLPGLSAGSVSQDLNGIILLPERAAVVNEVRRISAPAATYTGIITISADGRVVSVDSPGGVWGGNALTDGDVLEVDYEGVRPIPSNNVQMTIWYERRVPQMIKDAILGTSLTVIPRYIAPYLYTLSTGSGSQGEGYPFPQAYVQSPGVYPTSGGTFSGDHEFDGTGEMSISDFDTSGGFLQIQTLVPAVPNPQELVFERDLGDIDAEQRSFFKTVPSAAYIPSAFGQPISDPKKHKNMLPMIVETVADSVIGPKGSLLLVIISRWAEFDELNNVAFDLQLATNRTSASVYRVKGNPINPRRV